MEIRLKREYMHLGTKKGPDDIVDVPRSVAMALIRVDFAEEAKEKKTIKEPPKPDETPAKNPVRIGRKKVRRRKSS